jgi:hypothetical protein
MCAASRVTDQFWLGGDDVLADNAFFMHNKITSVLSVCDKTPPANITGLDKRLHIDIVDLPSAKLDLHFTTIVRFLHDAQLDGVFLGIASQRFCDTW